MLALFLFIICDVSNRCIGSQSKRAVDRDGRRIKSNTQHLQKNYVTKMELHCTVAVTWFCASVFWQLRDAGLRVKGVCGDDGHQVKLLTVSVPVFIEIRVVGVRTIGVSERDLLYNPSVVSGRSDQRVEAAPAAHS